MARTHSQRHTLHQNSRPKTKKPQTKREIKRSTKKHARIAIVRQPFIETDIVDEHVEEEPLLNDEQAQDPVNNQIRIKMSDYLRPVEKLRMDGNMSENWRRFERSFGIFLTASGVSEKGEQAKINTFLNAIGDDALDWFDTFPLTAAQKESYNEITKVFSEFCKRRKNTIYERFMFKQRHQKEGEPFDSFVIDLKKLVKDCEYAEKESEMLRDQIVLGINDKKMQLRLLETSDLTYDTAVLKCRSNEATIEQQSTMNKTVIVHELRDDTHTKYRNTNHVADSSSGSNNNNKASTNRNANAKTGRRVKSQQQQHTQNRSHNNGSKEKIINNCRYCGRSHKVRECPAFGKTCDRCNKRNHFSVVCRMKNVEIINESNNNSDFDCSDNEEFFIGTLENVNQTDETDASIVYPWLETVVVEEKREPFKIDTGAEIDVIPLYVLRRLGRRIKVVKTATKLRAFGGQKVDPIGMCYLSCSFGDKTLMIRFAAVDLDFTPILGLKTCIKFGIVTPSKQNSYHRSSRKHL